MIITGMKEGVDLSRMNKRILRSINIFSASTNETMRILT
jgi:hypothetical protein